MSEISGKFMILIFITTFFSETTKNLPADKKNITIVQVASMTLSEGPIHHGRPAQAPPRPPPKPSKVMLAKSLRQLRPLSPEVDSPSTSNERAIDIGDLETDSVPVEHPPVHSKVWLRSKSSIKKPSMKPPPPPISPKPNFKFTWQLKQSTSASNIYQSMSSPEDDKVEFWQRETKPSLPSMPPPAPPKSNPDRSEELYEDIDIGFNVS